MWKNEWKVRELTNPPNHDRNWNPTVYDIIKRGISAQFEEIISPSIISQNFANFSSFLTDGQVQQASISV